MIGIVSVWNVKCVRIVGFQNIMGPSIYQCNLGTNRKWKIRLCQEIRTQYQTHDDPNTRSHLVVLWRIPDFIRNMAAAAAEAVAYFPLSAAAAAVVAYIPLSAADTHHCSVDTDELFHVYLKSLRRIHRTC
jgi:hypothetical protein